VPPWASVLDEQTMLPYSLNFVQLLATPEVKPSSKPAFLTQPTLAGLTVSVAPLEVAGPQSPVTTHR